jgi:hypothetical protein
MTLPTLAVINFTSTLRENDLLQAIHAVNRADHGELRADLGHGRDLQLVVPNFDPADPETLAQENVPAESVMYLVDEASVPNALGFHDLNTRDVPFGFVFVLDPNDWTTALSHEALELILDPMASVLVPGPDPRNNDRTVLHAYEACDAVERLSYSIGDVLVSDFVTPSYFTPGDATGKRNDFLGVAVRSFGVTKGSHIAFFDLDANKFVQVTGQDAPLSKSAAARAERLDHAKPRRPSDDKLQDALRKYREGRTRNSELRLPGVAGLTRTARYEGASSRLRRK